MRNDYPGICYRCGKPVPAHGGVIAKVGIEQWQKWGARFSTKWLVQHTGCSILFRATDRHYVYAKDVQPSASSVEAFNRWREAKRRLEKIMSGGT